MNDEEYGSLADNSSVGTIERRSEERVQISTAVTLRSTTNFIALGENLSVSGIYLLVSDELPVGSIVDVAFSIQPLDREFDIAGEVQWSQEVEIEGKRGYGLGVEFLTCTDEEREALEQFVEEREPIQPEDSSGRSEPV